MPESQLKPVNKKGPWPLSSYSWYTTQRYWQHSLLFSHVYLANWIWSIPICIASPSAQSNIDIAQSSNGYRWGEYIALLLLGLKTVANNKIHESKITNTSVGPMCWFWVMVITLPRDMITVRVKSLQLKHCSKANQFCFTFLKINIVYEFLLLFQNDTWSTR